MSLENAGIVAAAAIPITVKTTLSSSAVYPARDRTAGPLIMSFSFL
jgi:hypothetical protein